MVARGWGEIGRKKEVGRGWYKVQTFSEKVNKIRGCNVKHVSVVANTVLYI